MFLFYSCSSIETSKIFSSVFFYDFNICQRILLHVFRASVNILIDTVPEISDLGANLAKEVASC